MKARFIFSVAAVGVTAAIGTASSAIAQEGAAPVPTGDPPTVVAPDQGVGTEATETTETTAGDDSQAGKEQKGVLPGSGAGSNPKSAKIKLYGKQLKHGKVRVAKRLEVTGKIIPYVANQRVQVSLTRNGHVMRKVNAKVHDVKHSPAGEFSFKTPKLTKSGTYKVRAHHALSKKQKAASKKLGGFRLSYPDLDPGDSGPLVKLMKKMLEKEGYYPGGGSGYSSRTSRALLAFRKVNNMARTYQANPQIFKMLAKGKGGFKLKYPDAGKHVEADLSRQVMVLANHGKPQAIFPISSGAPATPTIKGHFNFYSKTPGYNSHDMYYSVYFIRGYATHGYNPVPTYNASHGCLRNPIPDSRFIYNWIDLGDDIWVYN